MLLSEMIMHPHDKAALKTLKAIPGFSMIVKKFLSVGYEKLWYGVNMASNIRLSPRQLPEIYNHLPPICEKLGMEEPEFYLQMHPVPNACTYGDTKTFIRITSGLVECMSQDEIDAILAHECGHILCHHVLYHTMVNALLDLAKDSIITMGLAELLKPIQFALLYWARMSELSCDRVSALVTSQEVVSKTMARLAGGPKSITENVDFEEWAKQAEQYEQTKNDGTWNKTLQMYAARWRSHPFLAVRAKEVAEWCKSDEFFQAKNMLEKKDDGFIAKTCSKCGVIVGNDWKFCQNCGSKL